MPSLACQRLQTLFDVFEDFDALDLDWSSWPDLLQGFARRVVERAGLTGFELAVTDLPDRRQVPHLADQVILIREPAGTVGLVAADEAWWAGRLDLPPEAYRGKLLDVGDRPGGELSLVMPVRFVTCYGVARVTGPKAVIEDPGLWVKGLYALTQTLTARRQEAKRAQRQDFYRGVTAVGWGDDPRRAFARLCELWQEFSQADFTWLWLHNPLYPGGVYDLVAHCRHRTTGRAGSAPPPTPPDGFRPDDRSASEYAARTGEVLVIRGDLDRWSRTLKGVTYRVAAASAVVSQYHSRTLVVVPLVSQTGRAAGGDLSVRGAVCMHYADPFGAPQQMLDSLRLMGEHSAQALVNAFKKEQRKILVELTALANRHLVRVDVRPAAVRSAYLADLIALIQRWLHFRTVSVFYRRPFREAVECVATTGLARPDGTPVPDNRLAQVVYQRGEGRTGECFAAGQPLVLDPKTGRGSHQPRSLDVDPATGQEVRGIVFVPITRAVNGAGRPEVIGVIRCGQPDPPADGRPPNGAGCLPVYVQTLGFVVQQVGPLLQILEAAIRREQTISTLKHDLYTPLNMIRDTLNTVEDDLAVGNRPGEYDLKNLTLAQKSAVNLVRQLDAEASAELLAFTPVPTLIEGDVLAPLVNMLRHYAREEQDMGIEYDGVKAVFPRLRVDRGLIERAVYNLLVNAVKYGRPGTVIRVTARETWDGYHLDVANDGIGIDEADEGLIGEPNFRSDEARKTAQGAGLGVYIARHAMHRHGGKLALTSRHDPTVFTLFFPRALRTL